jgi:hypothetical protein
VLGSFYHSYAATFRRSADLIADDGCPEDLMEPGACYTEGSLLLDDVE